MNQLSLLACEGMSHGGGFCMLPPHITLYSHPLDADQPKSEGAVIDRLQQLADRHQPVLLSPKAIEATETFTQSLVLRFNSEALRELQPWFQQFCLSSPNALGYKLDPHVSLLYSQAPFAFRREAAKRIALPTYPLLFERVSAVTHPLTINSSADIAACTTLQEYSLLPS
ncbi:hypothetical protein SynMVIR181_01598 [Synechococcus sp. MVIR-18-1]|nr:hypothetical protein SynMVIR181_01598 [Synechococcus sp. MVIR-18-1]